MLARTKTKIEIVSDVIAGLGVLVVFGVTLAGGANYSRSKPASAAPANVITSPATAMTETNATLNGEIIASDSTVTARGFEWGTSTSYGNSLPDTPTNYLSQFGSSGSGDGQFTGPFGIALDASGNIYVTDLVNNRVQKFDSSGAYLSQFGSYGSGDGQFAYPFGITLDASGNIYVVDVVNRRVQKFDSSGAYLSQFGSEGSGDGQFSSPTGIALDASGNIFVADTNNHRVQKFDSSGGYLSQFGSSGSGDGQFAYPNGITLDASGNIYVADNDNHRVQKFDSSGAYLSQFGSQGSGDGQFAGPRGIALDASGYIYVTDDINRVQKFDSSGAYLGQFGSSGSGDGQFFYPNGITLDASGNIYVADTNNNRVQKFSANPYFNIGAYSLPIAGLTCGTTYHYRAYATNGDGTAYGADMSFSTSACSMTVATKPASSIAIHSADLNMTVDSTQQILTAGFEYGTTASYGSTVNYNPLSYLSQFGSNGSGDGRFSNPYGITLDASGNIYVVDSNNNRVEKFDSSGAYLSQFGSFGSGDGQFSSPSVIALDASGNIYVVDSYNSRVQKLSQKKYFATGAYSCLLYTSDAADE